MLIPVIAVLIGLTLLVWSADRFVDGSVGVAHHFKMPPLLIGMVIIGFGTSAPEMMVSALASMQGNPGIALGNAYGSNITNIALILGVTALINPILVAQQIIRKEIPILLGVSLVAAFQLWDGKITFSESIILLLLFSGILLLTILKALKNKQNEQAFKDESMLAIRPAIVWLTLGLLVLLFSSKLLVWGAVQIAHYFGVSDLIIGLTIVAIGTSLPELASSIMAAKRGQHDMALGNILGSNLFNTLMVVGIAGVLSPMNVDSHILSRDVTVMVALTVLLFIFCCAFDAVRKINRIEGGLLCSVYIGYMFYLLQTSFA